WPTVWEFAAIADTSVKKPAVTVQITDCGTQALNTHDPNRCVTPDSPPKPGCWIVHDVGNDAPCTGCVASPDDPNWGGPHLRHSSRSNVVFVDGHAQALKSSQWYFANTPWLKPSAGGEQ